MPIPSNLLNLSLDVRNTKCFINGQTFLKDLSGNGKDFTISNTNYSYDAYPGSLTIPNLQQAAGDPAQFAYGTGAVSISYWARLDSSGNTPYDFWLGPTTGAVGSNYAIQRANGSNYIQIITYSSPNTAFKRFSLTHDGKWHHLAFTRPINGTMNDVKFYLDGIEQTAVATDGLTQAFNTLGSGRVNLNSTLGTGSFVFGIFNIYTAELTSSQVLELYNTGLVRFATIERLYDFSVPACWDGVGPLINNIANAAYRMSLWNSPTFAGSGQSKYFQLNGSNQYLGSVEVNQTSIGGPYSVFTILAWFEAANTNRGTICSWGRDTASTAPSIITNDSNFVQSNGVSTGSFNPSVGNVESTTNISPGQWQMVAYVCDGTNTKIYVNGILEDTDTQDGGFWPIYGSSLLGARVGPATVVQGPYFAGKIAYVAQYKNTALPAESILEFYNQTVDRFYPPAAEKLCEIDFYDPACFTNGGTAVNDLSGNGNNWVLDNTSYTYDNIKGTLTLTSTNQLTSNSLLFQGEFPFFASNVPISLSYWFYYDSATEVNPYLNNLASGVDLTFDTLADGYVRTTVGATYVDSSTVVLTDQQYNNIQFTYDGNTWNTYVNNVLVANYSPAAVYQGSDYPQQYFNSPTTNIGIQGLALIDVYSGAIDSTTRTNIYNQGYQRLVQPLPPVTGLSNGRRFGQGFPQ